MKWFICVVFLLSTETGQAADTLQLHEKSMQWVAYYAAAYRVPVELVEAIIDEESGWNPYAVSSKGAAGIMQLMPETAIRFGVYNRFRVDENIRGGVAYLAWLTERFNGDLRLVTAAYYVGEGPISSRRLAYSCADVQRYVARVARRYRSRRLLVAASVVPAPSKCGGDWK
jgi:soluble lytic murein transglycosylase-like protein